MRIVLVALTLLLLVSTGCTRTPVDRVLYNFNIAIMTLDIDKAKSYCTDNFAETILDIEYVDVEDRTPMPEHLIPSWSDFSKALDTEYGNRTARVTLDDGLGHKSIWLFVLENGQWKLDDQEM